jgi:hypothetical protein
MVDGDAAATLGDIVRERWRRATGKRLRMAAGRPGDPWPSGVKPDLQHVSVAISRTEPNYDVRQEVREVNLFTWTAFAMRGVSSIWKTNI